MVMNFETLKYTSRIRISADFSNSMVIMEWLNKDGLQQEMSVSPAFAKVLAKQMADAAQTLESAAIKAGA